MKIDFFLILMRVVFSIAIASSFVFVMNRNVEYDVGQNIGFWLLTFVTSAGFLFFAGRENKK